MSMQIKDFSKISTQLAMIGQLGLSLIMPLLICIFFCYYLNSRFSVGIWVYIPGFFFGLGGSMTTAYKIYQDIDKKLEKPKRDKDEVSFNRHI